MVIAMTKFLLFVQEKIKSFTDRLGVALTDQAKRKLQTDLVELLRSHIKHIVQETEFQTGDADKLEGLMQAAPLPDNVKHELMQIIKRSPTATLPSIAADQAAARTLAVPLPAQSSAASPELCPDNQNARAKGQEGQECKGFHNLLPSVFWDILCNDSGQYDVAHKCRLLAEFCFAMDLIFPSQKLVGDIVSLAGLPMDIFGGQTCLSAVEEFRKSLYHLRQMHPLFNNKAALIWVYPLISTSLPEKMYANMYGPSGGAAPCPLSDGQLIWKRRAIVLRSSATSVKKVPEEIACQRAENRMGRIQNQAGLALPWLSLAGSAGQPFHLEGKTRLHSGTNANDADAKLIEIGRTVVESLQRGTEGVINLHKMIDLYQERVSPQKKPLASLRDILNTSSGDLPGSDDSPVPTDRDSANGSAVTPGSARASGSNVAAGSAETDVSQDSQAIKQVTGKRQKTKQWRDDESGDETRDIKKKIKTAMKTKKKTKKKPPAPKIMKKPSGKISNKGGSSAGKIIPAYDKEPTKNAPCPFMWKGCKVYRGADAWRVLPRPNTSKYDKKCATWAEVLAFCKNPKVPKKSVNYAA